jgi:hypothetical protein
MKTFSGFKNRVIRIIREIRCNFYYLVISAFIFYGWLKEYNELYELDELDE